MHLVTAIVLCLFVTHSLLIQLCLAWKPIVGSSFTTSFTLQQLHPKIDNLESENGSPNSPETYSIAAEHFGYGYDGDNQEFPKVGSIFRGKKNCAVRKFAFNQDGTAHYDKTLPDLSQFTICFWMRFTNHSGDHVILTYSAKSEPREIQFWVSNANNSSFISMAIKGQQIYRLNYPLRVRKWHHICSSWNGKSGEWQSWLKAERIGRGFHNSLVGHKIPAKGTLYSGGLSATGAVAQGLHFEVTFIQVYRIALSAGKAHRDHKHHHAHHFDHEGQELQTTTTTLPIINRPLPMHSLLANGQIPTRVRLNLAQPSQSQNTQSFPVATHKGFGGDPQSHAVTINTNFVNGQINSGSRLVAQQLIELAAKPILFPESATIKLSVSGELDSLKNPDEGQYTDETETRIIFKRQTNWNNTKLQDKSKTDLEAKALKKRGLVYLKDGSFGDEMLIDYKYGGLAEFGDQQFKQDITEKLNIDDEVASNDREPAEEEVKAVMSVCDSCDIEPFQGAIVFSWKEVKEQLDNALKGFTVDRCEHF